MFASSSTAFELLSYDVGLTHHFAEAPSPSPTSIRPFNKQILEFLDVEAEQGEDSDSHDTPSQ